MDVSDINGAGELQQTALLHVCVDIPFQGQESPVDWPDFYVLPSYTFLSYTRWDLGVLLGRYSACHADLILIPGGLIRRPKQVLCYTLGFAPVSIKAWSCAPSKCVEVGTVEGLPSFSFFCRSVCSATGFHRSVLSLIDGMEPPALPTEALESDKKD